MKTILVVVLSLLTSVASAGCNFTMKQHIESFNGVEGLVKQACKNDYSHENLNKCLDWQFNAMIDVNQEVCDNNLNLTEIIRRSATYNRSGDIVALDMLRVYSTTMIMSVDKSLQRL